MKKSSICRCCLTGGCYKDLINNYINVGKMENYGEMLKTTFNITLNCIKKFICEDCITKLRDATTFKQQILNVERTLNEKSKNFSDVENDSVEIFDVKLEPKVEDLRNSEYGMPCASSIKNETVNNEMECPKKLTAKRISTKKSTKLKGSIAQPERKRSKSLSKETEAQKARYNTIKLISHSNICLFKSLRTRFECYMCKETFFEIKDLREHSAIHSTDEVKLRVKRLRGMSFQNADITNLTCKLCSESCNDLDILKKHLSENHNVAFGNAANHLLRPYKLGDGFQCVLCKDTFNTFTRLSIHMNSHSTSNVCETCGMAYFSRTSLRVHIRGVHREHKCAHCPLTFPTSSTLARHLVTTHNRAPAKHYCLRCDMTFRYRYLLSKHMVDQHGAKNSTVKCDHCSKMLKNPNYLKIHIRSVHLKERNFPCSLCDLRFFTKTDKMRHENTHQGGSTFACSLCQTKFKSKDSERRHMKRQHGNIGNTVTK